MSLDRPRRGEHGLTACAGCAGDTHRHAEGEMRGCDSASLVAAADVRAILPQAGARRRFLSAVGPSTALAAIAQVFPLGPATALFLEEAAPEKKDLKVGFIPITCATPEVVKTAGWALIRDKTLNDECDRAHVLSPMPLVISLGADSRPVPYAMPAVENINGQAITLAIKHKERRDPRTWKGFRFAVPFDHATRNYLLRYYVAERSIDPDRDIQIRAVPPREMVANLRRFSPPRFLQAA